MDQSIDRRRALGTFASAALASIGGVTPGDAVSKDAELIALDAKIRDLAATARRIAEERFLPFEDEFREIACNEASGLSAERRWELACEFGRESGREAAAEETNALWDEADGLFERLCAIPANTPAGRAAKVRAHLVMTFPREMERGRAEWDVEKCVALLAELAGVSAGDIAAAWK
jgi:hypothetical protein